MKFNKNLIKTIIIVVLIVFIVLLLGIFFIPSYSNQIYLNGFINGQLDVAQTQTQTGNILIVDNGTVQSYPLNNLCEALGRI